MRREDSRWGRLNAQFSILNAQDRLTRATRSSEEPETRLPKRICARASARGDFQVCDREQLPTPRMLRGPGDSRGEFRLVAQAVHPGGGRGAAPRTPPGFSRDRSGVRWRWAETACDEASRRGPDAPSDTGVMPRKTPRRSRVLFPHSAEPTSVPRADLPLVKRPPRPGRHELLEELRPHGPGHRAVGSRLHQPVRQNGDWLKRSAAQTCLSPLCRSPRPVRRAHRPLGAVGGGHRPLRDGPRVVGPADQAGQPLAGLPRRLRRRGVHARRSRGRPGRQARPAAQAVYAGRSEEAVTVERPSPERKSWPPDEDKRGLECRYCGCRDFRVIYTCRGSGGKLIRRRECRHCGKRMTMWERPIGA